MLKLSNFFVSCVYFFNIFGFKICDFMFCSTGNAILGEVLSIVSCGSLEYCGLASKYVFKNIYQYISVVYSLKFDRISNSVDRT